MQKLKKYSKYSAILLAGALLWLVWANPVFAQGQDSKTAEPGKCGKNYIELSVPIEDGPDAGSEADNCLQKQKEGEGLNENPIFKYMGTIIRFLSAGVGVVVMLMIVISGIQYITSSGNPDAVAGAKKRLTNAVLALVLFIFMAAILNFLVPGGLL